MTSFRAAIVGCGAIHKNHIAALRSCPNAELVAVCDIDGDLAAKVGEEEGVKYYTDFTDVITDPDIDVVHICTPHYLHAPMAISALYQNKHVLTEKPMGMTFAEARDMINMAEDTGLALGVCFQNRYNYTSEYVKNLLDSGKVGKILGVKALVTWNRDEAYYGQAAWRGTWAQEGGGVLINQAIHTLDLIQWLVGMPVSIQAQTSCYRLSDTIEVEDTAHGYFRFENGATGIFYFTNNHVSNSPVEVEVICEKATIVLKDTLSITYEDGTCENFTESTLSSGEKAYWGQGHAKLIADYYQKLADGEHFPIDGREASKAIRMIEGIYRSSATGNLIKL